MAPSSTLQFPILLGLLLISFLGVEGVLPPSCNRYECPNYNVKYVGKNFEIRRYNSPVWISNLAVQDPSLVGATRSGFKRLFSYIYGNNNYKKEMNMTTPVISEVSINGGNSSIVVSFYVPKVNQADPPLANGLYVQRWKTIDVAVRQFGGFVKDSNIGLQVSALNDSLTGTTWSAIVKNKYIVAQYNSPFELYNRVNEIWFFYE
ncbi:hypothetical protein AAZX31_06G213000 [Glycine max]|uniref:Heme-binding protein 2 n=2 Tax=Glycine subgen. Soja TaxID=1462606 RepID=K7KWR1_SOYBN|nr:heme-binding protein 2 [Glycine max]XP_028234263.1 heme-binding protein 2-like [Glycine soja]KAH1127194.1 hypothetical protein GYH30_015961 [Glycine max]KAH1247038.1 Heme-binding protein 2 [Glycine max]KHN32522.1 Heme-binding protein 2 [Glycine soja]KRH55053.1 hypothetical protein GLYMA_06G227000v4 [Glycine max]RZC08779.1 Heme-binding protein 2 [Glycine soja]|eukprot:XP_003525966.1 heme-binding protein 2 [Glycine max]